MGGSPIATGLRRCPERVPGVAPADAGAQVTWPSRSHHSARVGSFCLRPAPSGAIITSLICVSNSDRGRALESGSPVTWTRRS